MKRIICGLLATLLASAFLVTASFAATVPYMGIQAGGTWVQDADIDFNDPPNNEAAFDTGFNVGVTGGLDCGPGRYELELTYRQNDFDKISETGFASLPVDGDISSLAFMGNVFWDIETGSSVTPYLGGGIGVANVSINDLGALGITLADDDDTVFAYQFGAGVALKLNPSMALDLGYRYFATSDPEFTDSSGDRFESEYKTHNASLGLRVMF